MRRFLHRLAVGVAVAGMFFAQIGQAANSNLSQFYSLTYGNPQIFLSSGTWKHPAPGVTVKIAVLAIGGGGGGGASSGGGGTSPKGGGGGGSGRVSFTQQSVTADQTVTIGTGGAAGSGGNTTSLAALVSLAGGSTGVAGSTSTGGAGGCGGGGGGGQSGAGGGAGLDYIGGGSGATADLSNPQVGLPGASAKGSIGPQTGIMRLSGITGDTNSLSAAGGWPNGGPINWSDPTAFGGYGGDCSIIFPMLMGRGAGGKGADANQTVGANTPAAASAGTDGVVIIWTLPIGS